MKNTAFFLFALLFIKCLYAQNETVFIVPKPVLVEHFSGFISISQNISLYSNNDKLIKPSVVFREYVQEELGFTAAFDSKRGKKQQYISLELNDTAQWCGEEGYHLAISETGVSLTAKNERGIFYGLQSLQQLLMHADTHIDKTGTKYYTIPKCNIHDRPCFHWRGMNIDCCRHFMEKDFLKRYIDLLAFHKMNILHWHLTDDQGWRIEIKKYPKLTEIGAWRIEEDGTKYGGFYSQNDIREIVAYAESRYITIVPEIEMPGHSVAALSAYPQLSCTGGPFVVENRWGVFKDIYCAGNDSVFVFLQDVLTEVMELFPSEYIHIGGDEAPKYRWEHCPKCQKRITDEGLADEHELQSWFITEIEKFLNENGRKLIGWDEILEGGLAPSATVQSWRGFDGAYNAATQNHNAVVSPTSHCYFDYDVATTNLEKVYSFNPVPNNLAIDKHQYILGGECNMWTEYAPQELIDSKVFPILCAISEVLWSPIKNRSFQEFHFRMQKHYSLLDNLGVEYGFENEPIRITALSNTKGAQFLIRMFPGQDGLHIHYTLNENDPDENSPVWTKTFYSDSSFTIKAIAIGNGKKSKVYCRKFEMHKAFCHAHKTNTSYSESYPASGEGALLDGIRGTDHYHDGIWQGYQGKDLTVLISLYDSVSISKVSAGFLQSSLSWIFYPEKMEVFISNDEETWKKVGEFVNSWSQKNEKMVHTDFEVNFVPQKAKFVKVQINTMKVCPDWHPGAGSKTWMFIDEIIVE